MAFLSGYVITLGGLDTNLYTVSPSFGAYLGIARPHLTLSASDILLVCAILAIWSGGGRLNAWAQIAVFVVPALFMLFAYWGNTHQQWSGLKLYVTAILSYAIGRWLSQNLNDQAARLLVFACLAAIAIQFVVVLAQTQGIFLLRFHSSSSEMTAGGRMVGLYVHPSSLGKTMLLFFCFLLPLSVDRDQLIRRAAYAALTFGSLATFFTLSRANSLAIVLTAVLWAILSGRASTAVRRLAAIAAVGIVVALQTSVISDLMLRQYQDPFGGSRENLWATGIQQIKDSPLTGTGPNYYLEVVGRFDPLAARGFPIHNSFLLAVAELGIPLALVFFTPLLLTVIGAAKNVLEGKPLDARTATLFSVLPGLFIIGWTGWGLVASTALPLWFMAFGFLAPSGAKSARTDEQLPVRASKPNESTQAR